MSVDPKEESKFKELTQGYSPDNYSVLKIRSHESRLRWLVYSILGFLALVIAIILYLQTLCLDTWYGRLFRIGSTCNLSTSRTGSTGAQLKYDNGTLSLVTDQGSSSVLITPLIPGAPQGLIGPSGLPGQSGISGAPGAPGVIGPQGIAGQIGPAGPAGADGGVNSVTNDINVTGSIAANVLTLGWQGQLSPGRGGTGIDGSAAPNGSLLIGNGAGYTLANIGGTTDQINVINGAGSITLTTPQDIAPTSNVTFSDIVSNGTLSANGDTNIGDSSADRLTVNAQISGGTPLVFQGSVDDGNATILAVTNPTGINTLTLPDASGTFAVSATGPIGLSAAGNISCATCVTTAGNGDIVPGTGISLTGTTTGRLISAGKVTFALNKTGVTAGAYGARSPVATHTRASPRGLPD